MQVVKMKSGLYSVTDSKGFYKLVNVSLTRANRYLDDKMKQRRQFGLN